MYSLSLRLPVFIAIVGWSASRCAEACDPPRLNEVQVIGTHNSYHIEPDRPMLRLDRAAPSAVAVFARIQPSSLARTILPIGHPARSFLPWTTRTALATSISTGHPALQERLLLVSVDEIHPAAAWMKVNDPIHEFDRIRMLVRASDTTEMPRVRRHFGHLGAPVGTFCGMISFAMQFAGCWPAASTIHRNACSIRGRRDPGHRSRGRNGHAGHQANRRRPRCAFAAISTAASW